MDRAVVEKAITIILTEIHRGLAEAAQIAKAAEVCALAGSVARRLNFTAGSPVKMRP